MSFIIGEKVEWTSQASGHIRTKKGIVQQLVPPNTPPGKLLHRKYGHEQYSLFEMYNTSPMDRCGYARNHESYLIVVQQSIGQKPKLYWPLVSMLRKVIQ